MRVFLTGFMGSGKTTVGRILAERLGIPFVDLDLEIELREGMSVREVFERRGEPAFRHLEQETLRATAALPDAVIATGGGTVTVEPNARWIQANGLAVWLNPAFATLVGRVGALGKRDRPLFQNEEQALALYRRRLPAYRRADLTVDIGPAEEPEEIAARIALLLAERRCVT
ncbi:MAG TPA: shikimate kinase [Thermoanaerobaculia bacterium]|jgi:shikimate kinase|nr:shikimate kinase [Thermoanaerobaculia bacterium]